MGLDGQINGGWVWVVGYGSGWIEMVMDGSVVVGESVGDGRTGGGQIGGCGFFFFWVIVATTIFPVVVVVIVVVMVDVDDDGEEFNILF